MKQNKAKKIILVLLAVICAAVLVYSLYQGLIIYIPQKQEQHRFRKKTARNLLREITAARKMRAAQHLPEKPGSNCILMI